MAKLGEVCIQITDGSHNPPSGVEQSEYLMLSSKNIDDDFITLDSPRFLSHSDYIAENNRTTVCEGDLLMTIVGTIGRVAIVPKELNGICLQRSVAVIKPEREIVNNRYLMYQLQNMRPFLEKEARGVAQKGIYLKQVSQLDIKIPELEHQMQIVKVLDKASKLIFLRKQQLAKLDELVKARFVEMFGNIIRNDKSWPIHNFSDIASSRLGKMLDAKQQTGKYSYPYLANFNVQWFDFNVDNLNQMDFNEAEQKEFELRDGDLLVCEGGEIGRCAVWHNEIQPCFFQKALHRVRCNRQLVQPDYLAWWFKYNCNHGGFAEIAGAKATIAHLPGIKLKQLQVALPPLSLQNEFAAFVERVDQQKQTVQQSLEKLELMKKALMQEYFG